MNERLAWALWPRLTYDLVTLASTMPSPVQPTLTRHFCLRLPTVQNEGEGITRAPSHYPPDPPRRHFYLPSPKKVIPLPVGGPSLGCLQFGRRPGHGATTTPTTCRWRGTLRFAFPHPCRPRPSLLVGTGVSALFTNLQRLLSVDMVDCVPFGDMKITFPPPQPLPWHQAMPSYPTTPTTAHHLLPMYLRLPLPHHHTASAFSVLPQPFPSYHAHTTTLHPTHHTYHRTGHALF